MNNNETSEFQKPTIPQFKDMFQQVEKTNYTLQYKHNSSVD